MIQKDKYLLLKDLCGRLPYGVKCKCQHGQDIINGKIIDINIFGRVNIDGHFKDIYDVKPYLFPLSSMTEEQNKEWQSLMIKNAYGILYHTAESFDYFYKNHFDYRGLIPMGLAIDATNLNIY